MCSNELRKADTKRIFIHFTFSMGVLKAGKYEIEFLGRNVKELFEQLARNYGEEFRQLFFNKRGEWTTYFIIMLNGKSIGRDEIGEIELQARDTVSVLQPFGGG